MIATLNIKYLAAHMRLFSHCGNDRGGEGKYCSAGKLHLLSGGGYQERWTKVQGRIWDHLHNIIRRGCQETRTKEQGRIREHLHNVIRVGLSGDKY